MGLEVPNLSMTTYVVWTNHDHSFDFENKTIGIIGGGSSAIQIIPSLQKLTGTKLKCFIRSKTWISRPFGDAAMKTLGVTRTECEYVWSCMSSINSLTILVSQEQRQQFAENSRLYLDLRITIERDGNSVHALTHKDSATQKFVRDDLTALMKEKLAKKPPIFDSLLPGFSVACRRLTPGPGYLEALVADNVEFINTPIDRAESMAVILKDGQRKELDVLVCATGFHTSAPPPFTVTGRDGQTIHQKFNPFPETYLSLAIDGFPNYFMMLGPNAAIGTGPLTTMIERTGDYIIKCIRKLQKRAFLAWSPKSPG
jgi:cation diffusion facilitator CzcD-associated flavoprotein CzcO